MSKELSPKARLSRVARDWPLKHSHTAGFMLAGMALGLVVVLAGRYGVTVRLGSSSGQVLPLTKMAQSSDFEMKLTNTHTIDGNDPAFGLENGHKFLVTTLSVTNKTSETIKLWPAIQTYIRDTQGGSFTMHPTTTITKPYLAGEIAPGQTVTGELSYDVPADLANGRLFIDPGWNSMQPVVFSLAK